MTKIITNAYFRVETDISQSVEDSVLDRKVKKAQDQLEFIIGRNFYAELVSQAITNPVSFTPNNLAFFDPYVKQYLAWQAYEYYIVRANTYETRMGIRIYKEDNSDAASDKTIGEMVARAKEDSQFYKGKMINFLLESQKVTAGSYPLYTDKCGEKMGPGFQITAINGRSNKYERINIKTTTNSDQGGDANQYNTTQRWP